MLPSEILMSVGLAGVFIPASSLALLGVSTHDAGVGSAVLNTSQQIGGSLGTALLNTLFAGAVTAYFTAHLTNPAQVAKLTPSALLHGYHVAFFAGAILLDGGLPGRLADGQRQEAGPAERRHAARRLTAA